MNSLLFFRRVSVTSLLLVVGLSLGVQTGLAQTPSIESDDPVASLRTADLTSDQELVTMATSLMQARAETEISFSTYREGISFFQRNYPDFYGNFFGDPFYATYDVRYHQLAREREQADMEANPQNRYGDSTGFLCHPHHYDPAFGGMCQEFRYASSDFFFMPMPFGQPFAQKRGPASIAGLRSLRSPTSERGNASSSYREPAAGEEEQDLCVEKEGAPCVAVDPPPSNEKEEPPRRVQPIAPEVELPELGTWEIETLSAEEWAEIGARLRATLSPEERQELIDRFGQTVSIKGGRTISSRRDWSPREEGRLTSIEREDRELERRLQRSRNRTEWNRTSNASSERVRSRQDRARVDRTESERSDRSGRDRSDRDRSDRDRSRSESSDSGR